MVDNGAAEQVEAGAISGALLAPARPGQPSGHVRLPADGKVETMAVFVADDGSVAARSEVFPHPGVLKGVADRVQASG